MLHGLGTPFINARGEAMGLLNRSSQKTVFGHSVIEKAFRNLGVSSTVA